MRLLLFVLAFSLFGCLAANNRAPSPLPPSAPLAPAISSDLQTASLCSRDEHVIFSCALKRPAKVISLCASTDLARDRGYLQYRFGLPGKIELEFPKDRQNSPQRFRYSHYFRFQVDLTEVKFENDGYQYSVFDQYNGEEKPPISSQGVTVTAPGKSSDVTYVCRGKSKSDYSSLPDVLADDSQ